MSLYGPETAMANESDKPCMLEKALQFKSLKLGSYPVFLLSIPHSIKKENLALMLICWEVTEKDSWCESFEK